MALADLIKLTEKDFKAKHKSSDIEFQFAADVDPQTGLIIDDPLLEYILDRRYLAYSRCYLIYGEKGASKSTLLYHLIKMVQQKGGEAVLIDTENATDLDYVAKQGVDVKRLVFHRASTAEEGLDLALSYARQMPKAFPEGDTPFLIGLDSLAGRSTEYESDQETESLSASGKPGEYAKLQAKFYRKLTKYIMYEKCFFVGTNQERKQIGGTMPGRPAKVALIGGEAQFFMSTYHWEMDKMGEKKFTNEFGALRKYGSTHQIKGKRNKLGREGGGQVIQIDFYTLGGGDTFSPLVQMLEKQYKGIITKEGQKFKWLIPDCKYTDRATSEIKMIENDRSYTLSDLAVMISCSDDAKNYCRKVFEIPDLPEEKVVAEVETKRKKKRIRKADEEEDGSNGVVTSTDDE